MCSFIGFECKTCITPMVSRLIPHVPVGKAGTKYSQYAQMLMRITFSPSYNYHCYLGKTIVFILALSSVEAFPNGAPQRRSVSCTVVI